uniref:Uncharacterized protein n=1 Tax=Sphaerodactylus townsendi TaxID=933632 RepID=A0ACB8EP21_9SAUR
MMPSKLQKNKQRLRNDSLNQNKGKPDLNTTLPIRQTASIFKQPVTKVTNHPSNKVKSDPQRVIEQPRQMAAVGGVWRLSWALNSRINCAAHGRLSFAVSVVSRMVLKAQKVHFERILWVEDHLGTL